MYGGKSSPMSCCIDDPKRPIAALHSCISLDEVFKLLDTILAYQARTYCRFKLQTHVLYNNIRYVISRSWPRTSPPSESWIAQRAVRECQ